MHVLIYLHHPAHFYLFKHTIRKLKADGHRLTLIHRRFPVLQ